jgi:hypothetical protein
MSKIEKITIILHSILLVLQFVIILGWPIIFLLIAYDPNISVWEQFLAVIGEIANKIESESIASKEATVKNWWWSLAASFAFSVFIIFTLLKKGKFIPFFIAFAIMALAVEAFIHSNIGISFIIIQTESYILLSILSIAYIFRVIKQKENVNLA